MSLMTPGGSILLADDEEKILKTLSRALREDGHEVVTTPSALLAQLLVDRSFDLLVIDYLMPERTGLEVIRELAATTPEGERPAIVMMTAHGTVERGRGHEAGGPRLPAEAVRGRRACSQSGGCSKSSGRGPGFAICSASATPSSITTAWWAEAAPRRVIKRAELVAESRSTVLVTGETGTGKELVARAITRAARSAKCRSSR